MLTWLQMKAKSVSDLLWILAHFGSHISDSPYLLEHIVEERFEVSLVYNVIRRTTDLCCAFLYLELATGWKAGSGFHSALGRLATLKNV